MLGEGEGVEELGKVVVSEKEDNTTALYGEVIMESVRTHIYEEDRNSDEVEGGAVDDESYDEEEVGDDDEVTDDVVIGGGSEEERGVEEELEKSGMGSNEILEYIERNFKCCFSLYLIVFSN